MEFITWIDHPNYILWSNGADFDIPILHEAFAMAGLKTPFKYWNKGCYRQMKRLYEDKVGRLQKGKSGTAHNSLDDAINQTLDVQRMYKVVMAPNRYEGPY